MHTTTLRELFYSHNDRLIHKWDHYFEIYEKYFAAYKGKPVNILEIGISHGGSLQLWKKYFGDMVHVYAIDVNPQCKKFEEEKVSIFIGSQSDAAFLENVKKQLPDLDIILDDGGHTMQQQIVSFEHLYLKVKNGGLYIVEDTHTSYWHEYHGGIKKPGSFIEYAKNLVDAIYEGHITEKRKILINEITRHINSIAFFDSIVVFDKKERPAPFHIRKGTETITSFVPTEHKKPTLWMKLKALFKVSRHSFDINDKGKA